MKKDIFPRHYSFIYNRSFNFSFATTWATFQYVSIDYPVISKNPKLSSEFPDPLDKPELPGGIEEPFICCYNLGFQVIGKGYVGGVIGRDVIPV